MTISSWSSAKDLLQMLGWPTLNGSPQSIPSRDKIINYPLIAISWQALLRDSHDSKHIVEYWKQDSSLHPHITNLNIQISPTPISHWFNHITLQHWMNECPPSIGLQIPSLSSLHFLVARPKRKNYGLNGLWILKTRQFFTSSHHKSLHSNITNTNFTLIQSHHTPALNEWMPTKHRVANSVFGFFVFPSCKT